MAIALHYVNHASVARALMNAVHLRRETGSAQLDELIETYVDLITKHHRQDLGIELKY